MVKRRELLKLAGFTLAQSGVAGLPLLAQAAAASPSAPAASDQKADYTLHIAPVTVELDRSHIISTMGYNGVAPGPVLACARGNQCSSM